MQTWPAQLAKSVYGAVTAPGDVFTGKANVAPSTPGQWSDEDEARLQMTNQSIADRTSDLAKIATPISAAARAGEGILGVPTARTVAPPVEAPTIPEMKSAAQAGYESPEVKGVKIAASAAPPLGQEIESHLNELGIDENIAPKTFGILGKLQKVPKVEEGDPDPFLTVDNLRSLRRTLGNAAGSIEPTERLAAKSAQQHIDEFLANLSDKDTIEGNPQAAAGILKEANANHSAMKAASDLDVRMTRADLRASAANSGMNAGNTIRQRMADIILTPKLARGYTPDELAMMKNVVEGGPMTNTMRAASNILGGGGGALAAIYGLGHAAWAPIAGYMLRRAYNAQTMKAAGAINQAVRLRSPLGQAAQAEAKANMSRPSLTIPMRSELLGPSATGMQVPLIPGINAAAQGEDNQRPPAQQKAGGRVEQQRAAGGKVEHKFNPESIGARKAKNGHYYIPDAKRPGKYLLVLPKKSGLKNVVH